MTRRRGDLTGRALLSAEVVVHTRDDRSIEGLVVLDNEKGVMLRGAKLLSDSQAPVAMAGEVWTPLANISFIQTKPIPAVSP